jgi:hypothetical protein
MPNPGSAKGAAGDCRCSLMFGAPRLALRPRFPPRRLPQTTHHSARDPALGAIAANPVRAGSEQRLHGIGRQSSQPRRQEARRVEAVR